MMTNFLITVVGLGSVVYLMKSDVRVGGAMLKRNLKTIKSWLEEEGASKAANGASKQVGESSASMKKPEGPSSPSA